MLKDTFTTLGLSETCYRIYNELLDKGDLAARQLAEHLSLPRPSVYDNLKILIENGLVTEREEDNKKVFQIDNVKNVSQLIKEKIDVLEKQRKVVQALLPSLIRQSSSIQPKIKFYSGVEGVKQVLNDFKWNENVETMSMWPICEMIEVLGKDYFEDLNRLRIKQNVYTRAIWPINKKVNLKDNPFMGVGKKFLREVRLAPKGMSWDMGYWIYGDKVAFISSRQEVFGFIIQSRDFRNLMKAQFEEIWKISKPLKPEPHNTDKFLETIKPQ